MGAIRHRHVMLALMSLLIMIVGLRGQQAVAQRLHIVRVLDHRFEPRSIEIQENDRVRWEWFGDLHNVVGVTAPGGTTPSGSFQSELLNTGSIFEVEFSREMLNAFRTNNGVFEYVCTPHVFFNMFGTIRVARIEKQLVAIPSSWQADGSGTASREATITLSADERSLSIRVASLPQATFFSLKLGFPGTQGGSLCSGNLTGEQPAVCALDETDVESLLSGEVYLELQEGENVLRGQIVRMGQTGAISGVVRRSGTPIPGVVVSAESFTTETSLDGSFRFVGIPHGVYRVSAHAPNFIPIPLGWSNPVLLSTTELYRKDIDLVPVGVAPSPTPTSTPSPRPSDTAVPTATSAATATSAPTEIPTSVPTNEMCQAVCSVSQSFLRKTSSTFDIILPYVRLPEMLESLKRVAGSVRVTVSNDSFVDAALRGKISILAPQGDSAVTIEVLDSTGRPVCAICRATVSVRSPLSRNNLKKVLTFLLRASRFDVSERTRSNAYRDAIMLLQKMQDGGAYNPAMTRVLNRRRMAILRRRILGAKNQCSSARCPLLRKIISVIREDLSSQQKSRSHTAHQTHLMHSHHTGGSMRIQ